MENKKYVFSYDDEYYNDEDHSTREKALEYAKKHWREYNRETDLMDGYLEIYIGEAKYYKDSLDVSDIIERQQDIAWDNLGEGAETYLDDVVDEKKSILEERLNKVWNEFKEEFKIDKSHYEIVASQKHEFNIYSEEFKKYYKEEN
ncbi:hypothetical protein [Fusobacterium ulcerans]|uniref:hypothetical protein n=1 Tax=Fusobacterium ulcerans TaxID=861 RepID=UPI00309F890F